MDDILNNLISKNDKRTTNLKNIAKLEADNNRIQAEICSEINQEKDTIIDNINNNKNYLEVMPNYAYLNFDELNIDIVSGIKDMGKALLIIDILNEISIHNVEEKQCEEQINNKNSKKNKFDKIVDFFNE